MLPRLLRRLLKTQVFESRPVIFFFLPAHEKNEKPGGGAVPEEASCVACVRFVVDSARRRSVDLRCYMLLLKNSLLKEEGTLPAAQVLSIFPVISSSDHEN